MGAAGGTYGPAVEDHTVAEVAGFFRGQAGTQLLFHPQGVLAAVGEPQAAGDADAVGVADIALLAVNIA